MIPIAVVLAALAAWLVTSEPSEPRLARVLGSAAVSGAEGGGGVDAAGDGTSAPYAVQGWAFEFHGSHAQNPPATVAIMGIP